MLYNLKIFVKINYCEYRDKWFNKIYICLDRICNVCDVDSEWLML